jgi:hypothetical protein
MRRVPHNYVLNRTVGDMLRSNQTISALGRLARRWAAVSLRHCQCGSPGRWR